MSYIVVDKARAIIILCNRDLLSLLRVYVSSCFYDLGVNEFTFCTY